MMRDSECRTDHLLGCMKCESCGIKKEHRSKKNEYCKNRMTAGRENTSPVWGGKIAE